MKILIVSDTHGRNSDLEDVVEKEIPFDMLIHCGDVEGQEFFIEALADCPCSIVAGNNDFFSDLPREDEIMIGRRKALVTHGHYYGISSGTDGVIQAAKSRGCEMVFYGHTHTPEVVEENGVLAVNPGSLVYPRQRGGEKSYAVMTTDGRGGVKVEIKYLKKKLFSR